MGTRTIVLDKLVILSSVSSVEGLPSPETSQGNALRADDLTDDIDTTDDIADDISSADDRAKADDILMADDLKENIVSYRTIEQQRISRLADDTDTNLKNDPDRSIYKLQIQQDFPNPKSKIQNPKWYDDKNSRSTSCLPLDNRPRRF